MRFILIVVALSLLADVQGMDRFSKKNFKKKPRQDNDDDELADNNNVYDNDKWGRPPARRRTFWSSWQTPPSWYRDRNAWHDNGHETHGRGSSSSSSGDTRSSWKTDSWVRTAGQYAQHRNAVWHCTERASGHDAGWPPKKVRRVKSCSTTDDAQEGQAQPERERNGFWKRLDEVMDDRTHTNNVVQEVIMELEEDAFDWWQELDAKEFEQLSLFVKEYLEDWGPTSPDDLAAAVDKYAPHFRITTGEEFLACMAWFDVPGRFLLDGAGKVYRITRSTIQRVKDAGKWASPSNFK